MKRFFTVLVISFSVCFLSNAQNEQDNIRERAIAQLDYCITSLSNITTAKSAVVFEHERDQLMNNVAFKSTIGLPEINNFQRTLLSSLNNMNLTAQESQIIRESYNIEKNNMMWNAFSNALTPAIVPSGSGNKKEQFFNVAFNAVLTLARAGVEYMSASNDLEKEEMNSLWKIHKDYSINCNVLLSDAHTLYCKLIGIIKEDKNMTRINQAKKFSAIILEKDSAKRLRKLKDNKEEFMHMIPFYYYVGMAYLDNGNYERAKANFDVYVNKSYKAKVLLKDEKLGCIALARLANENNLSKEQIAKLIKEVKAHLPNNGAAILNCAIEYINKLNNPKEAFDLLREGIDDSDVTNKDMMLMFVANNMEQLKKIPSTFKDMTSALNTCDELSINSVLAYKYHELGNKLNGDLTKYISLKEPIGKPWGGIKLWGDYEFKPTFDIEISRKYSFSQNKIHIYKEVVDNGIKNIFQYAILNKDGVSKEEIQDNVKFFKRYSDWIPLYFKQIDNNGNYILRQDIDYDAILNAEIPGLGNASDRTNDDFNDIYAFCKKHEPQNEKMYEIEVEQMGGTAKKVGEKIEFTGTKLHYKPSAPNPKYNRLLKIILDGPCKTIITYMIDESKESKFKLLSIKSEKQK